MDSNTKHRILFVCHGNICRSPMAEFVMKDLVKKVGLEDSFMIDSAATSTEEIGNSVYPPARKKLAADWHGLVEHPQHAEHLRWRPRWKNSDADGLHPSARRCGRPLVHGQL